MAPLAGFNLWSAFPNGLVAIEQLLFLVDKARSQGVAHLKRTLHGVDFLFGKFTGAHTTKHPIVLIHTFLLDSWEKRSWILAAKRRHPRRYSSITRAFPVELADCNQCACGQRPEPAAYLLDFLLVQFTSALANQYSVVFIHAFFSFRHCVR